MSDPNTTAVKRLAVLGMGIMGTPLARNLVRAGFEVRVWNRSVAKAEGLAADGALPASSPAAAATGVDVLITMLADGAAVEHVMTGQDGGLPALRPGAVWVQMGTIGVAWTDRLAHLAARYGVAFVDAPVSGSSRLAEDGQLVILASGAGPVRSRLAPIFEVVGRDTVWLERVGDGSRLKLALNNWLAVLVEGMAETLTLGNALGLDPHMVLSTIAGGPLAAPYATNKGTTMLSADFVPGFPLRHAAKDAALAAEAAHNHGAELPLTDALLARWRNVIRLGHGEDDVAAAITASSTTVSAAPSAERLAGHA